MRTVLSSHAPLLRGIGIQNAHPYPAIPTRRVTWGQPEGYWPTWALPSSWCRSSSGGRRGSGCPETSRVYIQPLAYTAERRRAGEGKAVRWYHVIRIECSKVTAAPATSTSTRSGSRSRPSPRTRTRTSTGQNTRLVPQDTDLFAAHRLAAGRESFHCQAEYAFHGHRLPAYTAEPQSLRPARAGHADARRQPVGRRRPPSTRRSTAGAW